MVIYRVVCLNVSIKIFEKYAIRNYTLTVRRVCLFQG